MSLIQKAATPSDVYRNPVLDNISIAAFQDPTEFVAPTVFPTVPVNDEAFKYYSFTMDSIAQDKAKLRAPGTEAEEGVWDIAELAAICQQWAYKEKLPEELIMSAGAAANLEMAATLSVAEIQLINAERRFATNYFATSKWGRDMVGAGSAVANTSYIYWSTSATSTPIDDVQTEALLMKLNGKRKPNTLVLGALVKKVLVNHPQIIGRLNNGQTPGSAATATLADLAKLFEVDRVLVSTGVYNSAKESATASNAFICDSKSALLCYVAPTPGVMTPSAGYRFAWQGIAGNAMGIRNWKYFDQPRRSWYIETAINDAYVQTAQKLGTFLSGIIA
jgi:hypothetical protein